MRDNNIIFDMFNVLAIAQCLTTVTNLREFSNSSVADRRRRRRLT